MSYSFAAVWGEASSLDYRRIIAILYVLTIVLYPDSQGMPSDLLLTTRLPELAFGMYFVRFIKKVPHVVGAAAVVLLAVQQSTDILKATWRSHWWVWPSSCS